MCSPCGPGEEEEEAAAEEATEEVAIVEEEAPAASDGEAEAVVEAIAEAVAEAAEVVAEAAEEVAEVAQEVETVAEEVAEVAETVEEAAQAVAAEEPEHNGMTSSSEEEAGATEAWGSTHLHMRKYFQANTMIDTSIPTLILPARFQKIPKIGNIFHTSSVPHYLFVWVWTTALCAGQPLFSLEWLGVQCTSLCVRVYMQLYWFTL